MEIFRKIRNLWMMFLGNDFFCWILLDLLLIGMVGIREIGCEIFSFNINHISIIIINAKKSCSKDLSRIISKSSIRPILRVSK